MLFESPIICKVTFAILKFHTNKKSADNIPVSSFDNGVVALLRGVDDQRLRPEQPLGLAVGHQPVPGQHLEKQEPEI